MSMGLSERERGRQRGGLLLEEAKMRWRGQKNLSPKDLRLAVVELCSAEYLATWGYEFGESQRRVRAEVDAALGRIQTEREARQIVGDVRAVAERILVFLEKTNHLELFGGRDASVLKFLLEKLGKPADQLRILRTVRGRCEGVGPSWIHKINFAPGQSDHVRVAMIEVVERALATVVNPPMKARDMAIVSCLLGIPWEGETAPLSDLPRPGPTPADFIGSEADRLGKHLKSRSQEDVR